MKLSDFFQKSPSKYAVAFSYDASEEPVYVQADKLTWCKANISLGTFCRELIQSLDYMDARIDTKHATVGSLVFTDGPKGIDKVIGRVVAVMMKSTEHESMPQVPRAIIVQSQ